VSTLGNWGISTHEPRSGGIYHLKTKASDRIGREGDSLHSVGLSALPIREQYPRFMSHRFTALFTHLVFSTKDRFPHLDTDLRGECFAYLGGILENIGARRIAIGGVSDHVHLLIDLPVTRPIAEVVRAVKANSSKWIHEKWPRRSKFAWQKGYAAFSVSRSSVDRVVRYIQNQERHHRRMTYQDEVRLFLKQHGMACDERYMWE
jgi:putative transposase